MSINAVVLNNFITRRKITDRKAIKSWNNKQCNHGLLIQSMGIVHVCNTLHLVQVCDGIKSVTEMRESSREDKS